MVSSEQLPLSLYVHIPFCRKKCLYCDFLSESAPNEQKEAYVKALLSEMDFRKEEIASRYKVKTIFIGGGTPTCLSPDQLLCIGKKLWEICALEKLAAEDGTVYGGDKFLGHGLSDALPSLEFTIEANPGTITPSHVQAMREMGVNRISLGMQSAQNNELRELGRIHTYEDFVKSYEMLRSYGFDNINIDVMADIPKQTLTSYRSTLEQVLSLRPEHISSYSLIVEEGTPFFQMQEEGKLSLPDEDTDREMYELTRELLAHKGYMRYEISNYAREGRECRHNMTYWQMGEYLGFGLGASSFFGGYRFSNVREMKEYLRRFDRDCMQSYQAAGNSFSQKLIKTENYHKLSQKEEMEEYVFLGLRMMKGISLLDYRKRFGLDFREVYGDIPDSLIEKCLLAENENRDRISLTNRGIDVSNVVLAEFLLDEGTVNH